MLPADFLPIYNDKKSTPKRNFLRHLWVEFSSKPLLPGVKTFEDVQFCKYVLNGKDYIAAVKDGDIVIEYEMDIGTYNKYNNLVLSEHRTDELKGITRTHPTIPQRYTFEKDKATVYLGPLLITRGITCEGFSIEDHIDILFLGRYLGLWFLPPFIMSMVMEFHNVEFDSTYEGEYFTYVHDSKTMSLTIMRNENCPQEPILKEPQTPITRGMLDQLGDVDCDVYVDRTGQWKPQEEEKQPVETQLPLVAGIVGLLGECMSTHKVKVSVKPVKQ